MPSQIRPNRPEVSDRFPMLGFTIKTDGGDKRYEVALASDFSLFRPDARGQRTRSNFYSSRCNGLQPITAGESVYVLPPEVLARFVGQEKLYYALVTYSGSNGGPPEISAVPSAGSAYISLRGLTGRSLKRIRILPNRQRANANYGNGSGTDLEWGGDVAMPGSQTVTSPAAPANGHNGNGAAAAPAPAEVNYSDGFGPMPPPAAAVEPAAPAPAPAAQGLGTAYRSYQMPVRAQSGESFSINWDDVQLIAQPTGLSCWATAGAMVLGWYNQQSITPDTVAQIAGRTTKLGIYPNEHCPFGTDIGLVCEAPQCYTIDGFRNLLENYGPLWVGVLAQFPSGPGGHAVVVTGMYSDGAPDGSDTYIRVTDPWDRVVGSPGQPGALLNTHNSGSRYIMSWAAFMQEYEDRASSTDGTVNVQILHATSSSGRQPSRSGAVGYAQAIALDGPTSFSINWDDVTPLAQPTDITGWAAAAAMIVDWDNGTSAANAVQEVINRSGIDASVAITPNQHSQLAAALNFVTENPAPLTFTQLQSFLDAFGPLWLSLQIGGPDGHAHSLVVTGMFSDGTPDGSDTFVRITDPWPRVVGTVGSPGAYEKTGGTPSQYIMKWKDFEKQFNDRLNAAPGSVLIMHAASNHGRQPRRQTGPGAGYAQSFSGNGSRVNLPPPPRPVIRSQAMNAAVGIASTIAGAVMERIINHDGSITWELEQLRGMKHPNDVAPSPPLAAHDAPQIRLNDWPFVEAVIGDRLSAWFSVDWQYTGRSVGNVQIANIGTNGALLRGLTVTAHIMDDNIVYPAGNPT